MIVYIVQSKETLIIYGCFDSVEKATKYVGNSTTMVIRKTEVL